MGIFSKSKKSFFSYDLDQVVEAIKRQQHVEPVGERRSFSEPAPVASGAGRAEETKSAGELLRKRLSQLQDKEPGVDVSCLILETAGKRKAPAEGKEPAKRRRKPEKNDEDDLYKMLIWEE